MENINIDENINTNKKLEFDEIYNAYTLCLKNKKRKQGTYNFTNGELCPNLINLMDKLNNHTYSPMPSNCYVITDPALREIYAAQFSDRIVQHFYMNEIENILDQELVDGCCSCRKGKGTDYALGLLKKFVTTTSDYGKKDCFYLKIDLSGYFMSIDRKQVSDKFLNLIINKYKGKHKQLLIYLTPLIVENNPAYHGVSFLGKVTYPYGYQKPTKQVIIRVNQKAKNIKNKIDLFVLLFMYSTMLPLIFKT